MTKTSYWIGLSRNNDGGLEWTDGSIVVSLYLWTKNNGGNDHII